MDKEVQRPLRPKRFCVERNSRLSQTELEQILENSESEDELFSDSCSELEFSDEENSNDVSEDSDLEESICVQAANNGKLTIFLFSVPRAGACGMYR